MLLLILYSRRLRVRLLGLLGYATVLHLPPKILLSSWVVKRKIAYGNSLGFQAQTEDSNLKCGILGEDSKNKRKKLFFSGENSPSDLDIEE